MIMMVMRLQFAHVLNAIEWEVRWALHIASLHDSFRISRLSIRRRDLQESNASLILIALPL